MSYIDICVEFDYISANKKLTKQYIKPLKLIEYSDILSLKTAITVGNVSEIVSAVRDLRQQDFIETSNLKYISNSNFWVSFAKLLYNILESFVAGKLYEEKVKFVSDTGAILQYPAKKSEKSESILKKSDYLLDQKSRPVGLPIVTNFDFRVIGFDGQASKKILGYIPKVRMQIPDSDKFVSFSPIVIDDDSADLVGMDVIEASGGGQFFETSNGMQFEFNEPDSLNQSIRIRSAEKIKIDPGHVKSVKINFIKEGLSSNSFLVESRKKKNNIYAIGGVLDKDTDKILIKNTSLDKDLEIQVDQVVANGYSGDVQEDIKLGQTPIDQSKHVKSDVEINRILDKKLEHIVNNNIRVKLKNL